MRYPYTINKICLEDLSISNAKFLVCVEVNLRVISRVPWNLLKHLVILQENLNPLMTTQRKLSRVLSLFNLLFHIRAMVIILKMNDVKVYIAISITIFIIITNSSLWESVSVRLILWTLCLLLLIRSTLWWITGANTFRENFISILIHSLAIPILIRANWLEKVFYTFLACYFK